MSNMTTETEVLTMLATIERLKAEAAAVRDGIRDVLADLEAPSEKTEGAHDLLEQAADLISELV